MDTWPRRAFFSPGTITGAIVTPVLPPVLPAPGAEAEAVSREVDLAWGELVTVDLAATA